MSSYRKEGLIVKEAIMDINNLHDFICETFGEEAHDTVIYC